MHRTIGILGGLSPESTVTYYHHIVQRYHALVGDQSYPDIVIYSVSFQRFMDWMAHDQWKPITTALITALHDLSAAGADFAVIATNTMHIVFDEVRDASPLPLLSIIDATAAAIQAAGLTTVGLLGTRFTMEKAFYRRGLTKQGIDVLIPDKPDRDAINRIVFDELARGVLNSASRDAFLRIIHDLTDRGAQGIVLGCTEIPLLVTPQHTPVTLFNTAPIHAEQALAYALAQ